VALSILVIGAENPRIRDLFRAAGPSAEVSYLNIRPMTRRPKIGALLKSFWWRRDSAGDNQATLYLPRRWKKFETAVAHWFIRRMFARVGKPDAIVFTWPQLAFIAERFPDVTRVYYCKDPFEYWSWGAEFIRPLETRLLNNVDAVFAIARALVEDFQSRTSAKIFYLPNAAGDSFISAPLPRPANLPAGKPIIGSVGQINATFDWKYVADLAATLPDVQLCFVGNVDESNSYERREIIKQLTTTPNIIWLGQQPHELLPAYIQHFDIAICLLKSGHFSDRRSPLRLYDYLAFDRPIITTDVREAHEHMPHLHIAASAQEAARVAREILAGEHPVDVAGRRRHIAANTWSTRAKELLDELQRVVSEKSGGDAMGKPMRAGMGV
jgi:glycosyltransferase involved in cell wall biosynthesis